MKHFELRLYWKYLHRGQGNFGCFMSTKETQTGSYNRRYETALSNQSTRKEQLSSLHS